MIDYSKQFRQLLLDAVADIPVYYELFDKKKDIPCISYIELNNSGVYHGDTLDYSHIQFRIKIWAEEINKIQTIATAIDETLQENGFHRLSTNETKDDNLLMKIMTYEGTGRELY